MMKFHTVELYLYQIALLSHKAQSDTENPVMRPSFHSKILCAGLLAAKSLLDFYISLPLRAELAFNNSEWVQIGFVLIVGSRLSLVVTEDPIYHEAQNIQQSLDMANVLKQAVVRARSLRMSALDTNMEKDIFKYEQRVRDIQCWFEKHSAMESTSIVGKWVSGFQDEVSQAHLGPPDGFIPTLDTAYTLDGMYDLPQTDYFPDSMEGVMEDWMSYPMVQF